MSKQDLLRERAYQEDFDRSVYQKDYDYPHVPESVEAINPDI